MTFHVGQTVHHHKFGPGTVVGLIAPNKLSVKFHDQDMARTVVQDFVSATGSVIQLLPSPRLKATRFVLRNTARVPRRECLYGAHYYRRFVSATAAAGGVGKSVLTIAEALAMSTGRGLLNKPVPKPLRVWLWNGEDPADELERRVAATCLHYRLTADMIGGRLFLDSGRDQEIVIAEQTRSGAAIIRPIVDAVIDVIRTNQIDVVIIDPFVSTHRVSENDNGEIDLVAKQWAKIADATNCAVELVHHVRKTGGNEATVEDARGASSLINAARSARALNRMSKIEAENAGVENPRLFFRVDNGKSNLAPPPDASEWHQLVSVDLENGPPGESDLVGVVTRWQWPDAFDGFSTADLLRVQRAIDGGRWRESAQAADWVGKPVADVLGLDLNNTRDKSRLKAILKTWIANCALTVVTAKDEKRMERRFVEVGEWAIG